MRTETQTWIVPARRAVWVPVELRHQVSMFGEVQMRTLYFHPEMRVYAGNRCQAVNVSNLMHELILHACTLGIVTPDSVETSSLLKLLICRAKQMEHQPLALPMPSDERASAAARLLLDQPALPLATAAG